MNRLRLKKPQRTNAQIAKRNFRPLKSRKWPTFKSSLLATGEFIILLTLPTQKENPKL
jgi:hypothetical protein